MFEEPNTCHPKHRCLDPSRKIPIRSERRRGETIACPLEGIPATVQASNECMNRSFEPRTPLRQWWLPIRLPALNATQHRRRKEKKTETSIDMGVAHCNRADANQHDLCPDEGGGGSCCLRVAVLHMQGVVPRISHQHRHSSSGHCGRTLQRRQPATA